MAMENLPEVDPPSGRVRGQGLLSAPILKRRRRRNKEGIGKNGSVPRGKYRRRGAARGHQGAQTPPRRDLGWGRATRAPGALVGPLWPPLGDSESLRSADFLYIFPRTYWAFKYWEN